MLGMVGLAASAQAGPILSIVYDPGKSGVIGPGNDLLDDIYGWGPHSRKGYFGASIKLLEPALVTFTYLGSEAGYTNRFIVDGTSEYFANHGIGTSDVDDWFSLSLPAGLIDFSFDVTNRGKEVENCPHGHDCNPRNGNNPRFFTSFDGSGKAKSGDSLVVFLDDDGRIDHDFDDMAVRIAAVAIDLRASPPPPPVPDPVPEPGSLLLMGGGLSALWARRRRSRALDLDARRRARYGRSMAEPIRIARGILIPESAIEWHAVRSSGPGGQNVNKVASKVDLRVRLAAVTGLAAPARARLDALAATRKDAEGRLVVISQRTRDQARNLEDARDKVKKLVERAMREPRPRRLTQPSRGAIDRRIRKKRERSDIKRARQGAGTDDE